MAAWTELAHRRKQGDLAALITAFSLGGADGKVIHKVVSKLSDEAS